MSDNRDGQMFTIRLTPEQAYVFLMAHQQAERLTRERMTRRAAIMFMAEHLLGRDAVEDAKFEFEEGNA